MGVGEVALNKGTIGFGQLATTKPAIRPLNWWGGGANRNSLLVLGGLTTKIVGGGKGGLEGGP